MERCPHAGNETPVPFGFPGSDHRAGGRGSRRREPCAGVRALRGGHRGPGETGRDRRRREHRRSDRPRARGAVSRAWSATCCQRGSRWNANGPRDIGERPVRTGRARLVAALAVCGRTAAARRIFDLMTARQAVFPVRMMAKVLGVSRGGSDRPAIRSTGTSGPTGPTSFGLSTNACIRLSACRWPTSPACRHGRASSACPSCSTLSRDGSSAPSRRP